MEDVVNDAFNRSDEARNRINNQNTFSERVWIFMFRGLKKLFEANEAAFEILETEKERSVSLLEGFRMLFLLDDKAEESFELALIEKAANLKAQVVELNNESDKISERVHNLSKRMDKCLKICYEFEEAYHREETREKIRAKRRSNQGIC